MTTFVRAPNADLDGVHPIGVVEVSFSEMLAVFGIPEADRHGLRWTFVSSWDGRTVTVGPRDENGKTMNVGSYNDSTMPKFVAWLSDQLDKAKSEMKETLYV